MDYPTPLWRLLEGSAALVACVLLAPLFLFVSLLILMVDGPPVLFGQIRVGRKGRLFTILKFRTMYSSDCGPSITASGDRRITRPGGWLRKFKIDELPQLVNVLGGSMSLIGPRPEVPQYVDFEDEVWRQVLEATPGITDLASLAFRDEEELLNAAGDAEACYRSIILPEKLRLNLEYHRSRSWARDFKLLWMTVRYSFFPHGFDRNRVLKAFES